MNEEFIKALNEIEEDKGVRKEVILEALEAALISSYKKNFGTSQNVKVDINRETGQIVLSTELEVVDQVENPGTEIALEEAQKLNHSYQLGDLVHKQIAPEKFGRIAAQTAKQVVIQRIKDAERDVIYEEFVDRENEIITGEIQRINKGNAYVDLGKTEAILPVSEQIQNEDYLPNRRYKMLILEVNRTVKGPQVVLSRSHPTLVRRLFELEVPEINEGLVEIYSIAREAGSRTKIAVFSRDEEIDALGACVGYKGTRVKVIVDELHDEKIDIVIWTPDINQFIANALSPSKVVEVFTDPKEKTALVVVPDYQLSLAIGKEGQNARLAAKLTNWKIDIKSEEQFAAYLEEEGLSLEELRENYRARSEEETGLEEDLEALEEDGQALKQDPVETEPLASREEASSALDENLFSVPIEELQGLKLEDDSDDIVLDSEDEE
ncbi:MAG: transcription termination factor NusA [Tissierellia bacterium]|nr:transcription termination factor NusA [Tissierellia bacterium]